MLGFGLLMLWLESAWLRAQLGVLPDDYSVAVLPLGLGAFLCFHDLPRMPARVERACLALGGSTLGVYLWHVLLRVPVASVLGALGLYPRDGAPPVWGFVALFVVSAALELMVLRGVATRDEVAEGYRAQRAKMPEDAARKQMGLEVNLDPGDKYAARENLLDCAARLPLCKGVCCFMEQPLQEDDLAEGVVRWDHLRPYWIRHRKDGGCFHLGPQGCKIFENRPRICRVYTCELDGRVWLDFAGRVPNSEAIAELLAAAAAGEEPKPG